MSGVLNILIATRYTHERERMRMNKKDNEKVVENYSTYMSQGFVIAHPQKLNRTFKTTNEHSNPERASHAPKCTHDWSRVALI
jgi:hypothetical protein